MDAAEPARGLTPPRLSVVLATLDRFAAVRQTVVHLARQSAREAIELVLVAPSLATLDADDELLASFGRVVLVEAARFDSIGGANAAGVRRASADVVALAEDHAFPDPAWAERLIAAHEGPYAGVGPSVANANPASAVSRADLLIGYGPWLAHASASARDVEMLPGHNSSYKRRVLLSYGDALEAMLDAETLLHWDLRARGERLRFEPAARIAHVNFSRWGSWLPAQFHYGRLFAGLRATSMSPARRAIYVAGSPLIPFVRLWRTGRSAAGANALGLVLSCLHALVAGLALDALGQMAGYALGVGRSALRTSRYEFDRARHVLDDERRALWPA